MTMEKSINYTQKYEIVTMDIKGQTVINRLNVCLTRKKALRKLLSMLIGIRQNNMEIVKPIHIVQGIKFSVYVYVNNKSVDFKRLFIACNSKGTLGEAFKHGWGLSDAPEISNITACVVESRKERIYSVSQGKEELDQHITNNVEMGTFKNNA